MLKVDAYNHIMPMYIRETIRIIDALDLSEEDRRRIYRDNAVEMLGLNLNNWG